MHAGGSASANESANPRNSARRVPGEEKALLHGGLRFFAVLWGISILFSGPNIPPEQFPDAFVTQEQEEVVLPTLGIRAPLIAATSWEEKEVGDHLQKGIVLLPTNGWLPPGHTVVTAHSSGGLHAGDYRFLFSTVHTLKPGDPVILARHGRKETYRVREQRIVSASGIQQLPREEHPTLTLVSCWPIGSNTKRLLVIAEQSSS